MALGDISREKAEILSVLLEGLLYGASLPMFGATIWALWYQRTTHQVNLRMVTVACLLLLLSTVHIVIHLIRTMIGVIYFQETHRGNSHKDYNYMGVPKWTLLSGNYVYTAQTLIGDGVILHRCYVVWQSKLVMILPVLLWCAVVATGLGSQYAEAQSKADNPFSRWMTAFWASTLATNLLTTLLLAYRIWYVNRNVARTHGPRRSLLQPMLSIIVDAGAIYSLTLVATLICFLCEFNFQYVIPDMVTPIISITFYMVIIRVGLASRALNFPILGRTFTRNNMDQKAGMQVHVMTYTENTVENVQCFAMAPICLGGENKCPSENKLDEPEVV